jgi:hypothetical protein
MELARIQDDTPIDESQPISLCEALDRALKQDGHAG